VTIKVVVVMAAEAVRDYTLLVTADCCLVLQAYTSPMTSLTCLTVIGAVLGHIPDAGDAHKLPGQSASALPDSEPSPRAGILSAKGCFLTAEPSPRVCSRRRALDRPQPVKALSLIVVGHHLGGCAPRGHNCSRRR
jgi:hypothetical protein